MYGCGPILILVTVGLQTFSENQAFFLNLVLFNIHLFNRRYFHVWAILVSTLDPHCLSCV